MSDSASITKLEESVINLTQQATEKDYKIKELQDKVDEAKPWFEMKESERKAEEEKIAKEKAEQEEAERIAKEKADAELKAKQEEEAKRKAEEDRVNKEKEQKDLENANCIKKAKQYINYSAFSRIGLIKQLEYEGYSNESAVYSVDSLSIDWNEQCAKKAKQYLEYSSFSRSGLYDQLEYEGFSDEQIQYGLSQVGY